DEQHPYHASLTAWRIVDKCRNVLGGCDRVLMMRCVSRLRKCQDLQCRKLPVQRVPVLDGERNVVVCADVQNRNSRGLERREHGIGRKHRIPGPRAKRGGRELDRNGHTAIPLSRFDSINGEPGCCATQLRPRLEEQDDLFLEGVLRNPCGVVKELFRCLDQWSWGASSNQY